MAKFKLPLSLRLVNEEELLEQRLEKLSYRIRVACPGFIRSFDPVKQTVSVELAIREKLSFDGQPFEDVAIPVLPDIPIFMPRAGNFVLTMPVTIGDECLVIFNDNCIDSWWETGKVGNQMDNRRHDLSDGFAILGVWSQPNVISEYSTDSTFLRNLDNDSYVEVRDNDINIITPNQVTVTAGNKVEVNAPLTEVNSDNVVINTTERTTINSKSTMVNAASDIRLASPEIHTNGNVHVSTGDTGVFTSMDRKMITVTDGIITEIQ